MYGNLQSLFAPFTVQSEYVSLNPFLDDVNTINVERLSTLDKDCTKNPSISFHDVTIICT